MSAYDSSKYQIEFHTFYFVYSPGDDFQELHGGELLVGVSGQTFASTLRMSPLLLSTSRHLPPRKIRKPEQREQ